MTTHRSRWWLVPLVAFILLLLLLWRGLYLNPHEIPSTLIGQPVPKFTLAALNESSPQLTEQQLRGHISLINVFASWCENCELEHSILQDIARTQHLFLFGLDYKDDRVAANQLLQRLGNPFQVIAFDSQGQLALNLGVYGSPETFIVDPRAIIRYKHIGVISLDDWQNTLLPVIRQLQQELTT